VACKILELQEMSASSRRKRIVTIIDNVPHSGDYNRKVYSTGHPRNRNLCWTCFLAYNGIPKSTGHRRKRDNESGRTDFNHRSRTDLTHGQSRDKVDFSQWMDEYASSSAEHMPNKNNELHLADYTWKSVYLKCRRELKENLQDNDPHIYSLGYNSFRNLMKIDFHYVKIRTFKSMGGCDDCDDLDAIIQKSRNTADKALGQRLKEEHLQWQKKERAKADKHAWKSSRKHNRQCMMIEIDGMDKSKTNLGKPATLTKRTADLIRIDTHVTGVFVFDETLTTYLVTWYDRFPSGSDSVITILNETLVRHISLKKSLPPTLYVHCDNCSRENKNK